MISWVSGTKAGIFLLCWLLQWITAIYGIFFSRANTFSTKIRKQIEYLSKPHMLAKQDVQLSSTISSFFCFSWAAISVFKLNWIPIFSRHIIITLWHWAAFWTLAKESKYFFLANFAKSVHWRNYYCPSTPPNAVLAKWGQKGSASSPVKSRTQHMNPLTRRELAVKKHGFIYAFPKLHSSVCLVYTWIYFTVARSLTFLRQSLFHLLYLFPLRS